MAVVLLPAAAGYLQRDGGAGHREVAVPPGELLDREPLARPRPGERDSGEDLVGLQGGLPDAGEEVQRPD